LKAERFTEERFEFAGPDPGPPKPGVMQVFVENGVPTMVDFLCPCGCGNTCPTHLSPPGKKTEHHWLYAQGPNGPTLSPSIRWTGGCMAHFNIDDGKVTMHAN
jgi:hypothetical protein